MLKQTDAFRAADARSLVRLPDRADQHVAASPALFASPALLFWCILRLVCFSNRD